MLPFEKLPTTHLSSCSLWSSGKLFLKKWHLIDIAVRLRETTKNSGEKRSSPPFKRSCAALPYEKVFSLHHLWAFLAFAGECVKECIIRAAKLTQISLRCAFLEDYWQVSLTEGCCLDE